MRQVTNLGLGEASLLEGAAHTPLAGCLTTRAVVTDIIGIGAIHHSAITLALGVIYQPVIDITLTEIAALRRVGQVMRIVRLMAFNKHVARAYLTGNGLSLGPFPAGNAGRKGRNGQHPVAP